MTTKSLRIVTATALSMALAVSATAFAEGNRGGKSQGGHAKADQNRDGVITQNEVPAKRWMRLVQADANKDGKVTRDELAAFFKEHKQARFKAADKNGDGALSQNEVPAKRWERIKQADSNKDSKVSRDELTAFFKATRPERRPAKAASSPHS